MRLLTTALAALPVAAAGNFITALHSHFVVNLDFEGDAKALSAGDGPEGGADVPDDDVRVMAFAGGERKFKCRLPNGHNRTAGTGETPDASKSRAHFISAKMAPLRGNCWVMRTDYWSYDVCFGRRIVQYRSDSDVRFSLGEHASEADELLQDGGVREFYLGGTDNRTTELRYVCGSSEASTRTFKLEEERPLYYVVTVSGPAFCLWREKGGTEVRDASGNALAVSSMVEELRGSCINITLGWWGYEYCYPGRVTQFHLQGKQRDTEYVLGALQGSSAADAAPGRVEMEPVRLKPSASPRERRAQASNHWSLRQSLGGGTVCDETGRARSAQVHFQCPPKWQARPETRIVSINEGALCEYEVLLHTTLLCGHPRFLPTLPREREAIQCIAEPPGT